MNKKLIRLTEADVTDANELSKMLDSEYTSLDSVARKVYPPIETYYQDRIAQNKKNKQPIENRLDKVRKSNEKDKRFMQRLKKNNNFTNESKNSMKKQIIKLTESDLHNIIKESVKRILKESNFSDNDLSWRAKNYQDERDKFLTNPDYTGTPSQFDPNNYREAEDFVDDEESGLFDTIKGQGYKGVTDDDSIYTNVGNFNKLANITRQHLRNNPRKPHLH